MFESEFEFPETRRNNDLSPETMELKVVLAKETNEIIKIGKHYYEIGNELPKLKEWYINMYMAPHARSVQIHTHIRHIKNHQRDYRYKYCRKILSSTNPNLKLSLLQI